MSNPLKLIRNPFHGDSKKKKKSDDGRDQWQSRTSYVLASMSGAIGFGNLLRFPSQVFNNNGLQWFIPYFLALGLVAIPALILEVALGSSLRGGPVLAYNALNKRTRGAALGNLWVSALVVLYYVPMLSWVLRFFRASFESPLPWDGNLNQFWEENVLKNVAPVPPDAATAIDQGVIMSYPGTSIVGEHVGWNAFSWFIVWLCIYNGVSVTGKVVYFTMGLPIIMVIVLIVRGATLPNAIDGIRLYVGEFNAAQLIGGQLWQDALGQVFYSTGVGFGYYTAYASYNAQNANAAQDAVMICSFNSLFEISCGFAVFAVVGYMGITPEDTGRVGSFTLGFITLPEGLARMPGAQAWAVIFFFTLFLLAVSSAFVQLDTIVTTVRDTDWGRRVRHIYITSGCVIVAFLISIIYNTEFGPALLDAIDLCTNNLVLPSVVFFECYSATVIYRSIDVIGQVGVPAFAVHQTGFLGGMLVGLLLAHNVGVAAGVGAGFAIYFALVGVSILIANSPDSKPPAFWSRTPFLSRLWWLAFYSGNQLRRDLNVTVASGNNWSLPWYWAICLRYITCPVLAIVFSFSYPSFMALRSDPLTIFAFSVSHFAILTIVSTLVFPRWMDPLIPSERREEGTRSYAPPVILGSDDIRVSTGIEIGHGHEDSRRGEQGVGSKFDSTAYGFDQMKSGRSDPGGFERKGEQNGAFSTGLGNHEIVR